MDEEKAHLPETDDPQEVLDSIDEETELLEIKSSLAKLVENSKRRKRRDHVIIGLASIALVVSLGIAFGSIFLNAALHDVKKVVSNQQVGLEYQKELSIRRQCVDGVNSKFFKNIVDVLFVLPPDRGTSATDELKAELETDKDNLDSLSHKDGGVCPFPQPPNIL
jgi:hypothetical protein